MVSDSWNRTGKALAVACLAAPLATQASVFTESELSDQFINNTFATPSVVSAAGTGSGQAAIAEARLTANAFDTATATYSCTDLGLTAGGVVGLDTLSGGGFGPACDSSTVTPTAGQPFLAVADNSASEADLTIGSLDAKLTGGSFNVRRSDDDGSPLGDGYAPVLADTADAAGDIHIGVSGYSDFTFDGINDIGSGPHGESGLFDLHVFLGRPSLHDIDFFLFTGLTPGALFYARTVSPIDDLDTVLGWYDPVTGATLAFNDDQPGGGFQSQISGFVPAAGSLLLGVSAYDDGTDSGADGAETGYLSGGYDAGSELAHGGAFSTYQLVVTTPEPQTVVLLALGLTGLARRRAQRR